MDVQQAFDPVRLVTMSDTMRDWDMNATLTVAILREQVGDKYDVCFPETKDTHKFLMTRPPSKVGREARALFNLVTKMFHSLQE